MTHEPGKTPLLRVKNLGLRHRDASEPVTILNDVSFALERGEILGIIGESGAGKSTLGNAVLGLLAPEFQLVSGTIEFEGKAIDAMRVQGTPSEDEEYPRYSRIILARLIR